MMKLKWKLDLNRVSCRAEGVPAIIWMHLKGYYQIYHLEADGSVSQRKCIDKKFTLDEACAWLEENHAMLKEANATNNSD